MKKMKKILAIMASTLAVAATAGTSVFVSSCGNGGSKIKTKINLNNLSNTKVSNIDTGDITGFEVGLMQQV